MPTPHDEILAACRAAGRAGKFSTSEEAQRRAYAEGHSPADLRHALSQATRADSVDGRWVVRGPSLDGAEVRLNVVLTDGALSVV